MLRKQLMYDRLITIFSPEGRLLQVEYALEMVKKGSLTLGSVTGEGVVLAVEERLEPFQGQEYSRKLFIVDDNMGVAVSGFIPDGRVLVNYARGYCQTHRLIYDELAGVEMVAKRISNIKKSFTQRAMTRPFGVSMIFGGLDPSLTPRICLTDPSGNYMAQHLAAIGSRADSAKDFLSDKYSREVSTEEAKVLLAAAIRRFAESPEQVKIRFLQVPKETFTAQLASTEESSKYLRKAEEKYG